MSFKYRFILSFVLLEVLFIMLIVLVNFVAIQNSSTKLIQDKIKSNIAFMDQLLKVPISIFDLATLDNLVESTQDLKYINSIVVLDAQNNILSQLYNFPHKKIEELIQNRNDYTQQINGQTYEIRYQKLFEEDTYLGSLLLVFDTTENTAFIAKNRQNTILIVMAEILISTLLSYVIGSRLTRMLENLSEVATHIGENKEITIPYQDKKDEIGTLSRSMKQMRVALRSRSERLKNLARELNNQKNELIEANKSKDDFLANMSHELKTPLNSINVISSVMMKNKKGDLDEMQVKNLTIINNCGKDLLFLINDILDISKMEAGELELSFESFDVKRTMTRIHDMFAPQVKQKQLQFVYEFDESLYYIYSDRQRIKQMVKNLLSNALKFTKEGNITLRVKDEGINIHICVEDEGIGIKQEKLEHIFDRFKQADGSTTRQYGGTGLGLAITKELSHLLNGEITVESEIGKGTAFCLTIPKNEDQVVIENSKEDEVEEIVLEALPKQEVKEKPVLKEGVPKVLLLNNDPIGFMSIVVALNKDVNLEQVNSLEQLKNKTNNETFDWIIVDVSNQDVTALSQHLVSFFKQCILVCSSSNDLDEGIKSKVHTVFEKPLSAEQFLQTIQS